MKTVKTQEAIINKRSIGGIGKFMERKTLMSRGKKKKPTKELQ